MDLFNKTPDYFTFSYEELKNEAQKCTKCGLSNGRTKVVFGEGPVPCDLMLIGEGPGEQEDQEGLPFVGKAGQLLSKILESIGIKRPDDIYIANIVKCRPPENRTPTPEESMSCYPYLAAQIRIVKPQILLLAGSPSTKTVLNIDDSISKVRGKWFKLPGTDISVMPIFHPSYLLRNQAKNPGSPKWLTWQDMKEVQNALDFIKQVRILEGK